MLNSVRKKKQGSSDFYEITITHQVIFWIVYFIFNFLRWGSYYSDYWYSFKSNLIEFPIHIILCYTNIYFLMPRLVFKKKYLAYTIIVILAIFLMAIIKFNLTYYLLNENVWPEGPVVTNSLTIDYIVDMMIGELYVITFVTAIKITLDWIKEHKRLTELEKLQLETELRFLKTQISPHFFFNTLNNIYALALEKSDKTPKIILKLSELMRYLIYETKHKRHSLKNEILCIENYLELEKIRYGDKLQITMGISGDINDKKNAPILLLSFIENAFKHGANKNIGEVKISIDFKIVEDFLYFSISNPLPLEIEMKQDVDSKGGVGLKNVRKRLALGYRKDEYELDIEKSKDMFVVKLKIKV